MAGSVSAAMAVTTSMGRPTNARRSALVTRKEKASVEEDGQIKCIKSVSHCE